MSVEIIYIEKEKRDAMKYVEKTAEKFIGEGKITHISLNKDLVRFVNDQSARKFIDEVRKEFGGDEILINFKPFYKSRR
jgi:hypothetical protein